MRPPVIIEQLIKALQKMQCVVELRDGLDEYRGIRDEAKNQVQLVALLLLNGEYVDLRRDMPHAADIMIRKLEERRSVMRRVAKALCYTENNHVKYMILGLLQQLTKD